MVELYINEELIDLSVDQVLAMTYQVNDIGNIQFQRANFSNQFKIPKTKENCRKFGFIDQVTSADMRPYRALPARIIQDGEEIVRNGVAQVLSVDDTINIVIYSGIKDFFETIGDAKLSDLDLSDLDHTWDLATIKALAASEDGICYPLINYGALPPRGRTITANYQFFSIYVKTLFERIFAAAGFEYHGSFLDHPAFDKLILPFSNDKYLSPGDVRKNGFVASGQAYSYGCYNGLYQIVGQPTGYPSPSAGCGGLDISFTGALNNITGNENGLFDGSYFTVGASLVRGQFRVTGKVALAGADRVHIKLVSSLKGVIWRYTDFLGVGIKNLSGEVVKSDYLPGETVHVEIASQATAALWEIQLEFVADEEVVFGSTVDVARNLPEMKQKDFLKGIAHMFGLIYEQDENIQRVRIRQFDEIQTNKGAAIDWSDKLHVPASADDRRKPQIVFGIGYARVNHFRYKEDENVTEGYGDAALMIDNQNLDPEKTVIELPFAATESETQLSGFNVPQIVQFQRKDGDDLITDVEEYNAGIQYSQGRYVTYNGALYRYINQNPATGKTPKFDGNIVPTPTEDNMDNNLETYWQAVEIDALMQYEREFDTEPRILIAEKIDLQGDDLTLRNELTGGVEIVEDEIILPYFIKPGGEFNLGFADSLLEKNYKTITDITQKTKFVKAYFNLTGNDVKNIDYLIPRYVSYFGAFFYINRIEKFRKGRTTLVHLVRV